MKGGNATKRILLRLTWPGAAGMSAQEIEDLLARPIRPPAREPEAPTADPREFSERVARAANRLRGAPEAPPVGRREVPRVERVVSSFLRDPEVVAWASRVAAGRCELCGAPAPFLRDDGEPYLEIHHLRPLSEGGPDTIDNVLACCPTCHRRLHHGADRESLRRGALKAVPRLRDHPLAL